MSDTIVTTETKSKKASWKIEGTIFNVRMPDNTTETFDMTEAMAHEAVKSFVLNYGMKQLLSDSAAGEKGTEDKLAAMREKAAMLNAGELKAERKGKEPQKLLSDEELKAISKMPANVQAIVVTSMDKANKALFEAFSSKK